MTELRCFKAYDVRGQIGVDLDAAIAYRIGRAFAQELRPGQTVTGRDIRPSSAPLQAALISGLRDGGSDVIDIGLCGTEEVYFATDHYAAGGGLMVTASHNPIEDNGIKLVQAGARPLGEPALSRIKARADTLAWDAAPRGALHRATPRAAYAARLLAFVDGVRLRPLRILVNAGHGVAGPAFDAIATALHARGAPLEFIRIHHAPDGRFPIGIPNPLLAENRPRTARAVRAAQADFGVAWDGDGDRCFFFDGEGRFVAGEYVVALLAAACLAAAPNATGARIVHDPRVVWNIRDVVARCGGQAVVSRTGHARFKARMRAVDALYGGEISAHHYFRDFMYCDSGMIPWLLVAAHMSTTGQSLAHLVEGMRARFASSGEINFALGDPAAALERVAAALAPEAIGGIDRRDGISMEFGDWRMNLRRSQTEPLLRLNVETRGDPARLRPVVTRLSALIAG